MSPIFAAVASQYIIASNLPDTNILTMADLLHIVAFVFIFLSIAESVLSTHVYAAGDASRMRRARRLDAASVLVLGGSYAALSVCIIAYWGVG